ncbi:hypothetical protein MJD09_08290, partial [bacterium]|nr:hypothetical protein [bacterium]
EAATAEAEAVVEGEVDESKQADAEEVLLAEGAEKGEAPSEVDEATETASDQSETKADEEKK